MSTTSRPATATNVPFVVGGVGHRVLPVDTLALQDSIRRAFAELIAAHDHVSEQLRLVVSVAEGADRLLIDAAIELGIPYVCVLPCSPTCFAEDFPSVDSVETFQRQLSLADGIVLPDEDFVERVDGYLWVSRYLVEHCDVLIAVWNGENGNGPGGTADTVEFATRNQVPVVWISASPPHDSFAHQGLAVGLD